MDPDLHSDLVLLILYAVVALGISFFCSIFEAVLLSITPSYIGSIDRSDKKLSDRLYWLKNNVNDSLAAILSLNTMANTFGAAGVGAQAGVLFGDVVAGVVTGVLTLFILVFSEIIPKTLGAVHWRKLAKPVSFGLGWLVMLMRALGFVHLSRLITGVLARGKAAHRVSREELSALADIGAREGVFEEKESHIVRNLLKFRTLKVNDIMTPRTVVQAFDEETSIRELLEDNPRLPFSRIPIYEENLDEISGYVLKDELLHTQADGGTNKLLKDFRRDLHAVPNTMPLLELFGTFLDRKEHIALVVDEYGGMAGIVTMEDIIETLLGMEIVDEMDHTVDMQDLARDRWRKRAKALGLKNATIGGLQSKSPARGEG